MSTVGMFYSHFGVFSMRPETALARDRALRHMPQEDESGKLLDAYAHALLADYWMFVHENERPRDQIGARFR